MSVTTTDAADSSRNTKNGMVLVTSQSGAICRVLEKPESIFADATPSSIDDLWSAEVTEKIRTSLKRALRNRNSHSEEIELSEDGASSEFIYVAQGPDRVLLIVRDLSDQKRALSRVEHLAYTDELTGLPNREYLFRELVRITDIQKLRDGRAGVICIKVGRIDDMGYARNSAQQDALIQALAARLSDHLRGSNELADDNYERSSLVARTDFSQFAVVLPSIESGEDAEAVAERLVDYLQQPVVAAVRAIEIRAAAGIALFPQDGIEPAALWENAVAAMEDASVTPGSSFKFHSGTLRLRSLQRQDLDVELRSALERDEYALSFLPIVRANTAAPVVIEALLRWPSTLLGQHSTRKVVKIAERTGLILPIGEWVIRRACEQLKAWHEAGHTHIRLAINLSMQEFVSDGLIERIAGILNETDTSANDLDIEITERILIRDALKDYVTSKALKSLGVRIVVDDYGIGSSSLANLSQAPIDAIKIDNSFVANIASNADDKAACVAAIAMAGVLNIDVIAEGVETEEQSSVLQKHGCQFLQGFYYCKPKSDLEIIEYLDAAGKIDNNRNISA